MQKSPDDYRADRPRQTAASVDTMPRTAICPHCGKGLVFHMIQNGRWGANWKRRAVVWTIAGIVVLSLVIVGYLYRGHLFSALDLVDEATGNRTITLLSLALLLSALACMVFWMILPIFLYLGLKDLRRRTASVDQTMRLFVSHQAQPMPEPEDLRKQPGCRCD